MSFETLADNYGIKMFGNDTPLANTGLDVQLTEEGMKAFLNLYYFGNYREDIEKNFRVRVLMDVKGQLYYKLVCAVKDEGKYPLRGIKTPYPDEKAQRKDEIKFLSGMFEYFDCIKLSASQKFLPAKIARIITDDRDWIEAHEEEEHAKIIYKSNFKQAEEEQHHPERIAIFAVIALLLGICLFINAGTADFGALLIAVFVIIGTVYPFVAAWQYHDNVEIRHSHGVYDRKRDRDDNTGAVISMASGVSGLKHTKKWAHKMTFGDGKHHSV